MDYLPYIYTRPVSCKSYVSWPAHMEIQKFPAKYLEILEEPLVLIFLFGSVIVANFLLKMSLPFYDYFVAYLSGFLCKWSSLQWHREIISGQVFFYAERPWELRVHFYEIYIGSSSRLHARCSLMYPSEPWPYLAYRRGGGGGRSVRTFAALRACRTVSFKLLDCNLILSHDVKTRKG